MNIRLIGYGKMGHIIEDIALQRDHKIASIIDVNDSFDKINNKEIDVAIDFTTPNAVLTNMQECFKRNIPLVVGTTGWYDNLDSIKQQVEKDNLAFVYSSNFAIGVMLFRKLNVFLAKMMNNYASYTPSITEIHHIHKLDAPSGTAITLANEMLENYDKVQKWDKGTELHAGNMPINSVRKGEEFGTHIVAYDSEYDAIEITHTAKSRKGLALGAVMAAEFIQNKKGFYKFDL